LHRKFTSNSSNTCQKIASGKNKKNEILVSSSILARKPIFLSRVALGPLSAHRLGSAENGPLLEGMPRQGRNLGLGQEFAPRTRSPRLGLS
jgi:hypothetical protein